jgi:hypothetical protein
VHTARRGTVQHQTKVFYFVALEFARLPDYHIVIHNICNIQNNIFPLSRVLVSVSVFLRVFFLCLSPKDVVVFT